MTDALEARLTAAMVDLRPRDSTPADLRDRVLAIPDADAARSERGGLRGWLLAATSIACIAAILAFVKVAGPLQQPGAGRPTNVLGVDPNVEGPGLITSFIATLPIATVAVIAALVTVAIRRLRQSPRRSADLLAATISVALAAGVVGLAIQPGPGDAGWNGFGPVLGFRQVDTPGVVDEAGSHLQTLFAAAEPNQPFAVVFVVGNPGPFPVRLEGVREDPDAAARVAPRWTALAIGTDPRVFGQPIDKVASFVPTEIPPGGYVLVYLIGKASRCAIGAEPYAPDQAFAVRGPDIELVYSIFGLTNTSTYRMPMVIEEPIRNGC